MYKYLYLSKLEWAEAWVSGGDIPISLASRYLSNVRNGTATPDENTIFESPMPRPILQKIGIGINECKNITISRSFMGGIPISHMEISDYAEDGLILSFCNSNSEYIARRLGKVACVKILKMAALKECFDEQLGCCSVMKKCDYTKGHERNLFLKSIEDSWQDEYRLFWKLHQERSVCIPAGFARLESVYG